MILVSVALSRSAGSSLKADWLQMGKDNFQTSVYGPVFKALGQKITVKISCSSSKYVPGKNYAGLVIYHNAGSVLWKQAPDQGIAAGRRGRSFYALILCTDSWSPFTYKAAGKGIVHDYLFQQYFGMNVPMSDICCAGFAVRGPRGTASYTSGPLNSSNGRIPGWEWKSDGSSHASLPETALINFIIREWKAQGPSTIVQIPDNLHVYLYTAPATISRREVFNPLAFKRAQLFMNRVHGIRKPLCPAEFQDSPDDPESDNDDISVCDSEDDDTLSMVTHSAASF